MSGPLVGGPADVLAGIRVVEFGQYIAAPAAGAQLAALGADVVKVEPPGGEVCRHIGLFGEGIFNAHNAGKRSVELDLRSEGGREVARRLIAAADVVVQNMRPDGMEALGLGYEVARDLNPDLIYASVSGYGTHGPSRERPGLDIAAQAESGLMWIVGEKGGEPLRVTAPVVDAATAHVVTEAVLGALFRRERNGTGAHIEVSLLDVAIQLQATMFQEYEITGAAPERCGNGQAAAAPAADLVRTRDGYLVLSAYTAAAWEGLCGLIGRPDLITDERFGDMASRVRHRSELLEVLGEALSDRDTESAVRWLTDAGIVAGSVRSYPMVAKADDVVASGIFGSRDDGSRAVLTPYLIGGARPGSTEGLPTPGSHTGQVLLDLGYDDATIHRLATSGAVGHALKALAIERAEASAVEGDAAR
jgi:crotonobetainyl-CoA:carnitine CoA-transferase CaiB-like acyl-CoA transferase